jgi:hypothetical protein
MIDALSLHLAATAQVNWACPPDGLARRLGLLMPGGAAVCPDPHNQFINRWDAGRAADRAERMRQALDLLRECALRGRPVCWTWMQEVQRVVLGHGETGFRRGPAWAKGGREWYGSWAGLEGEFARKIAADDADDVHPVAKAVRLFLDLCFFHPFPDGNARAARLWLAYLLRRGGCAMAFVEPLFVVERFAGDIAAYVDFLRLAVLSCERGHQLLSRSPCGPLE